MEYAEYIVYVRVLGIITTVFFVLAGVNGLKKYVKSPIITSLAAQHKLFGALAAVSALVHMVVAISFGELSITGTLSLVAVIATGVLGFLFSDRKEKKFYVYHRIAGPVALLLIIAHIILNGIEGTIF
jgi:hypothetical protein